MLKSAVLLFAALLGSASASAATISLTGSLDPEDPNSAFVYGFRLASAGQVTIQSWGYGGGTNAAGTLIPSGGFDTYLTLFEGWGPGATFLESNDEGICPPANLAPHCHDSRLQRLLPAGDYTVALTAFFNMSFAENYGPAAGLTLGDGFVGLGSYYEWDADLDRTSNFALDIDGPLAVSVAEPSSLIALVGGLMLVASGRRRAVRSCKAPIPRVR